MRYRDVHNLVNTVPQCFRITLSPCVQQSPDMLEEVLKDSRVQYLSISVNRRGHTTSSSTTDTHRR